LWTGAAAQRDALDRVRRLSAGIHEARRQAAEERSRDGGLWQELEASLWRLLRAETSCNFFWGEAWVARAHGDLDHAERHLARARSLLHG
jgi:4-alpha-glucanotransferase